MTDLDQARDKIEKIIHTDEYQIYYEDNRNFIERWWDSVLEWLEELLGKVFGSLAPANGLATGVMVIMTVVVIILVVSTVFFLVRSYRRKLHYHERKSLYTKEEKDWTYLDHLSEASKNEGEENLQLATRHLFLALLLNFHEKGFVEARIWKTNWEYYEEIKQLENDRAENFYKLASIFDAVVYGEQLVNKASYVSYKNSIMKWITEPDQEKVEG